MEMNFSSGAFSGISPGGVSGVGSAADEAAYANMTPAEAMMAKMMKHISNSKGGAAANLAAGPGISKFGKTSGGSYRANKQGVRRGNRIRDGGDDFIEEEKSPRESKESSTAAAMRALLRKETQKQSVVGGVPNTTAGGANHTSAGGYEKGGSIRRRDTVMEGSPKKTERKKSITKR